MHRLLLRQLKKAFGRTDQFSPELERFIAMVNDAYQQDEEQRAIIQRSVELSSREVLERNRQLAEAETKYRTIFENATEGIFQTTPDGQIISANPSMARILGYQAPAELLGINMDLAMEICVATEKWREMVCLLESEGSISQHEFSILGKDGKSKWLSVNARLVKDPSGEILFYEGTFRDITQQKLAEEDRQQHAQQLANSISLLNATLESTPDGIVAVEFSGKVICFNRKYADMWGIPEELLWRGTEQELLTFVSTKVKDPEYYLARIVELKSTGVLESSDVLELLDGRTFERYVAPQYVGGKPVGMVIVFRDVTERRAAEDALRKNREELRSITEAIPHLIWTALPNGELDYCSQRAIDYFGRTSEDLTGTRWVEIMHPDDVIHTVTNWSHALNTGEPYENEFRLRRSDGTYRWHLALAMPLKDIQGKIIKWYGTNTDIDDQKRAENALRESDEKFRQLSENINDVFWITSLDHQTLYYASPAYETVWGNSLDSLYANPQEWINAILPEDLERVFSEFSKLAVEDHVSVEYRIRRADGEVRWIGDRCFRVLNTAGEVNRIAGFASDITERKQKELELLEVHKKLLETSRQAGMAEVATNVLHNIGNVLNSVNVACSVIAEQVRKSRVSSVGKVAAMMREHSANLSEFVTNNPTGQKLPEFLSKLAERLREEQGTILSELESLNQNIEHIKEIVAVQQSYAKIGGIREPLSITSLVEDALQLNAPAFSQRGVKVMRSFESVPLISSEKHKLLQILINLVRNASDALAPCTVNEKWLAVCIACKEDRIVVSMTDNGVGIAPENLTRIFAHGFTTKKNGHGFGLHSSVLAAREMGCKLSAHSEGLGTGATFTLELPLNGEAL